MSSAPPSPGIPSSEPPLWAPYYGAPIGTAFTRFWKKYATFSGRASRSEYWWWYLIAVIYGVIVEVLAAVLAASAGGNSSGAAYTVLLVLIWIIALAAVVPSLALVWRRLHDTNRSGGYYFMALIPLAGPIILIVLLASASHPAGARFDVAPAQV